MSGFEMGLMLFAVTLIAITLRMPVGLAMITTPTKPMATAAQRYGPTLSLRKNTPSTGMNKDAVNNSTVVSAIGMSEYAANVVTRDTAPRTARKPTAAGWLRITRISRLPRTNTIKRNGMHAMRLR